MDAFLLCIRHQHYRRVHYVLGLSVLFVCPFICLFLVLWHIGRTSVVDRWTFPVLRSTCTLFQRRSYQSMS